MKHAPDPAYPLPGLRSPPIKFTKAQDQPVATDAVAAAAPSGLDPGSAADITPGTAGPSSGWDPGSAAHITPRIAGSSSGGAHVPAAAAPGELGCPNRIAPALSICCVSAAMPQIHSPLPGSDSCRDDIVSKRDFLFPIRSNAGMNASSLQRVMACKLAVGSKEHCPVTRVQYVSGKIALYFASACFSEKPLRETVPHRTKITGKYIQEDHVSAVRSRELTRCSGGSMCICWTHCIKITQVIEYP